MWHGQVQRCVLRAVLERGRCISVDRKRKGLREGRGGTRFPKSLLCCNHSSSLASHRKPSALPDCAALASAFLPRLQKRSRSRAHDGCLSPLTEMAALLSAPWDSVFNKLQQTSLKAWARGTPAAVTPPGQRSLQRAPSSVVGVPPAALVEGPDAAVLSPGHHEVWGPLLSTSLAIIPGSCAPGKLNTHSTPRRCHRQEAWTACIFWAAMDF
nr:uncharacterized protein LOC127487543 [Oryctolagus cuniculus]